ncbi:transcriptional regulator [Halalkalibacillus sediminis]|uniref:Catabolite control protein A n=1 Tax=Halalkalibacillus sediminis TaxID=2018042 RepID=A0A2I0QU93_9BACI|nr:LacI family DNA-binding transcriptional regulator [Halalkalibacillus sediminis]PKR77925.1 transcriptional regulator [Halalkalibacillus sediminis]
MTTIKDVAKEANVSVATVSRVLNQSGYVNNNTKKRVEQAIERLDYQPNSVARSLFKKESKTIGFIVPDISNPFFPMLVRAAEDYLNKKGFTIILCNSDEEIEKEQEYLNVMKQKYVDGVIAVSNHLTKEQVESYPMPIVALDRPIEGDIPSFSVDNRAGGVMATEYLKEIGCRKIAHIRGPEQVLNATERYKGYVDVVGNEKWFSSSLVVHGEYDKKIATQVAKKLLQEQPDIDGVFAGNDMMALGVLKAAEELELHVPEDVAVIGFDGIDLTEMTSPELSTISQPLFDVGTKAAMALVDMIQGRNLSETKNLFPLTLMKRQSTIFRKEV